MMNINSIMSQFQGFMRNPVQFMIQQKLNIPQNIQNNPDQIIQYMMNSGQLTQEQYNSANQMARQIQNNPQFSQMFGNPNNKTQ